MSIDKERQSLGGEETLTDKDMADLGAGTLRVYQLMCDGHWHSPEEIRRAAGSPGHPASEGLRRMRVLRRWYVVERHRISEGRVWHYRLCDRNTGDPIKELHRRDMVRSQLVLEFSRDEE